ncbi:MAG: DUF5107 domain-containing protein [Chloroflexota bacterium]|nr:DUF5107 domain-containing protein [Chloroflexota bacterium]
MDTRSLRNRIQKALAIAMLLATGLATAAHTSPPRGAHAQPQGRFYPQTGKTLAPEFLAFYDGRGGVSIFGYPLTEPETEGGVKVQYLERARIEYHPQNRNTPYEVQLGLLGSILTAGRQFPTVPQGPQTSAPDTQYFPETRHTLSGPFLRYWRGNGGLALFGYPISEPMQEGGLTVQYFERNRFELHPEMAGTPYEVQLGLLGRDLLAQRVQVKDTTVTIPTYAYEQAFYSPANDPIAPYPRLDFDRVGPPSPRNYRLIVLENRYIKLTILPQVGGRLYEAIYKPTGHNELYRNPVIKPSRFGERGWWLAAGGMEWAAPTQEHGMMEYLPWDASIQRNSDGGVTVTLSANDKLTGLTVVSTVSLSPEDAAYTTSSRLENRTNRQATGQLWSNAIVAPGGTNTVSPRTRFIVPASSLVVHSTNDSSLPPEHGIVDWPQHDGKDLADMSTWNGWFGAFAMPTADRGTFAAVYNPDADEGVVKTFKSKEMPGLKIFGFGPSLNPANYTDDQSSYAELWGGIVPTFWDNALFPPNSALGWTERWQPIAKTGGVSLASAWGTVALSGTKLSILPTRRIEGATLTLRAPDGTTTRTTFNAYPDRPTTLPAPASVADIEITAPDGTVLLKGAPVK